VIAALGATALKAVLKRNGITKLKNNVFYSEEFETKVIPIYHPAYILRNPGALTDFQKGLGLLKDESGAAAVLRTSSILADHYDVDTREKVDKVLDQLEKVDAFVFDLETSSLQFTGAKILCVALSWRSGLGVTIKWDLFSGEQLYRFQQILCSKVLKVNHNLKFDLEMLMGQSLKVKGPYFDTLLAASLIDENVREKSLDALTLQHLDIGEYWAPLEEEKARICKERKIHKKAFSYDLFDYKLLADYAQWDADATFRLYELFSKELIKQDLADYYRKYSNPTMQLLVCMEFRGVLVDRKKLALLIETYRKTLLEHSKGISANKVVMEFERGRRVAAKQKIAVRWHKSDTLRSRYPDLKEYIKEYIKERDWQFNQKSVPQLSALLFEQLNLTPIKYSKRTKKPSTDEETLTTYAAQGVKLCQDIIDYRGLSKYIATYLVSTYDKSKKDKRIHANYLQAHTVTGRLSCVSPNMQNIPRGAKDYKECLIADPGFTFVKADLKQAEFRCWAHCSNDLNMIRAIEQGMDIHKNTASSVFQVPEDEVTEEQRTAAKAVTFGLLMYGMGDRTAAKRYNLSVKQVASLRTHFFAQYPVAGQWLKEQVALVHEHGYVKTWLGRYRRLPEIFSDDDMLVAKAEREATNAPIQGLASNLNDHFMVKGYKLAVKNGVECCPAATQHDAQIFLVREGQEKKMVKIMKHVAAHAFPDFRCKMVLDFEVGKTFGSLEKYHG
jgi:DNA polymerase-1